MGLLQACALATGGKEELLAGAASWKPAVIAAAEAKASERSSSRGSKIKSRGSRDSLTPGDDRESDDGGAADEPKRKSKKKDGEWSIPKEFMSWLPEQLAAEVRTGRD